MRGLPSTCNRIQTLNDAIPISKSPVLSSVPHSFFRLQIQTLIHRLSATPLRSHLIWWWNRESQIGFGSRIWNQQLSTASRSTRWLKLCRQDNNGKFDKGQLMRICPYNYRQTPPPPGPQHRTAGRRHGRGRTASTHYPTQCDQIGEARARHPSICPYPQRPVPVCSRYDVAALTGSSYV